MGDDLEKAASLIADGTIAKSAGVTLPDFAK
jgi:hypothetical protein